MKGPDGIRGARRVLVRGVNWLGDAVMTTPALMALREALPDAEITLLTASKLAGLWVHAPFVDRVRTFSADESPVAVGRSLRDVGFDLAVVFPNSPRAALEAWWARIPMRVGYRHPWRAWMLTDAVPRPQGWNEQRMRKRRPSAVREALRRGGPRRAFPKESHHVHHYLGLIRALGFPAETRPPALHVTEAAAAAWWSGRGVDVREGAEGPLLGLNPNAEYGPAKRWPAERFVEAAVRVLRERRCRWVLFGGAGDTAVTTEVARGIREAVPDAPAPLDLAGRTTLEELPLALRGCRLLLTNDTGPMHVAAAVGCRVIVPFGSTSPELTGPGGADGADRDLLVADVPCAPCFLRDCPVDLRCLLSIEAAAVADVILARLAWRGLHRTDEMD